MSSPIAPSPTTASAAMPPAEASIKPFTELGLLPELLRAVSDEGYDTPTPIQAQAIPLVLKGLDVLAAAQTGTGKTAGFTLPLLHRLHLRLQSAPRVARRPVRALILVPTRELAAQVEESVRIYGKYLPGIKTAVVFGGVNINPQIGALRAGVDILVATPGRLLDHTRQRTVDLSQVETLVLDEADRMLDMGFIHDIKKVLALLPPKRQNLLFSATFSDEIKRLADGLLNAPTLIEVARRNAPTELVTQVVHPVDRVRKHELLSHLARTEGWKQVLVFTRTKHGANRLCQQLERDGISALAIHGNKSQPQRTKALADFKRGAIQMLVATDIAARGLDIDQLPHVINYELPNVPEDYVHRIGRTGRAGSEGDAVSLVCVDELKLLADIERLLKRTIPRKMIEGFAPDPSIAPEPIPNGRNGVRMRRDDDDERGYSGGGNFQGSRHGGGNGSGGGSRDGNRHAGPPRQNTVGNPQYGGARPGGASGRPANRPTRPNVSRPDGSRFR